MKKSVQISRLKCEFVVIEIENLSKSFESLEALKGINLNVKEGDFFGLLGPNGAGKSTLINILCGLLSKDSGAIKVNGHCIDQNPTGVKYSLGVVPQEFNFSVFETCEQIVCNQAGYYGVSYHKAQKEAATLFKMLELTDKSHQVSMRLSGGMKRRLMIARALVHAPPILILDEPTAGVDIAIRRSMWKLLRDLNAQGTTIILTTHYLEEAENLCNRLAFINKGRIIKEGSKDTLLDTLTTERIELECNQTQTLPLHPPFHLEKISSKKLAASISRSMTITSLIDYLKGYGVEVLKIKAKHSRLEELFIEVVDNVETTAN